MNKVILLGRLTKDPDIRMTQTNNTKVAKFTLAVNRRFIKPDDEQKADFINIITFGKTAEFVEKYVGHGQQIALCGRIQNRSWDDENGSRHYITEVVADEVYFADRSKKQYGNTFDNTANTVEENDVIIADDNDDLPF